MIFHVLILWAPFDVFIAIHDTNDNATVELTPWAPV
jgi:hypothetical protein